MIREIIAAVIFVLGVFFFGVGVLGLLRFPDVYTRLHATTKADTLGAGLVLLSLIIYQGFSPPSIKLALMIVFIWISNPTAAHAIARAAYTADIPMVTGSQVIQAQEEESSPWPS